MTTAETPQWYWIITLHAQTPEGRTKTNTITGTHSASSLTTRRAAFPAIQAEAMRAAGWTDHDPVAVLFFSLEPDDLSRGGNGTGSQT